MKEHYTNHKIRPKVQRALYEVSFYLELAAAVLVIALIIGQIIGLGIEMFSDAGDMLKSETFTVWLETCLNVVIGIEFLKMLCRHNMSAVIEVLLFTLARHLIVAQYEMLDGLLCVIAISLLFVVRKYLFIPKIDKDE